MKVKNHWTASKKRAARIVDLHRGELAEILLEVVGKPAGEDAGSGASWYIPGRLTLDITYQQDLTAHKRAQEEFENAVGEALVKFLEATE